MHTASLRVRGYECDPYGHVNNAVYLNYLETARDHLLIDHGLNYQELLRAGGGIWVAEANLKYVSPAVQGEELTIRTVQEESGAVSAVLKQTIWGSDERLVLEARIKLVWVSGGKPSRIPADWKARFAEGLAP
jgi:YbgC/YbaW family acyl-CoA thioester hydrolase